MMNLVIWVGLVVALNGVEIVRGTCTDYPANSLNYQYYFNGILYRYQAPSTGDMILTQTAPYSNNTLPNNLFYTYTDIIGYCGSTIFPNFVPLLEYYSLSPTAGQRHLYTINPSEFPSTVLSSYNLTGTVCHVSAVPFDDHVPAYRFWNGATGTFLYTTNLAEGIPFPSYWTLQALPFYIGARYGTPSPFYPVPLYRYRRATSSDTYLTTLTNPPLAAPSENYNYIGVLGSCYPNAHNGWSPIFEYASGTATTGRHHIYTTNWGLLGGGANGFTYQGIPCYVQLTPTNFTLPTYQFSNANPPSKTSTLLYTTNSNEPAGDTQVTTWTLVDIPWYMFVNATCDTLPNPLEIVYRNQANPLNPLVLLVLLPNYYANNGTLTNVGMAFPFPITGTSPLLAYFNPSYAIYYTTDWTAIGGGGGTSGYMFMGIVGYMGGSMLAFSNTHPLYRFRLRDQPTILDYSVNMMAYYNNSTLDGVVGFPFNYSAIH